MKTKSSPRDMSCAMTRCRGSKLSSSTENEVNAGNVTEGRMDVSLYGLITNERPLALGEWFLIGASFCHIVSSVVKYPAIS